MGGGRPVGESMGGGRAAAVTNARARDRPRREHAQAIQPVAAVQTAEALAGVYCLHLREGAGRRPAADLCRELHPFERCRQSPRAHAGRPAGKRRLPPVQPGLRRLHGGAEVGACVHRRQRGPLRSDRLEAAARHHLEGALEFEEPDGTVVVGVDAREERADLGRSHVVAEPRERRGELGRCDGARAVAVQGVEGRAQLVQAEQCQELAEVERAVAVGVGLAKKRTRVPRVAKDCPERCVELRACELAAAICIGTLEDSPHTVAVVGFEVVM